jgi:peptidoglycan/xylan/chitin deacetylase (PgdA/CDA1 family)
MTAAAPARVPILMYHEIAQPTQTHSRLAVSPENFAAQLGYLRSAGFTTLTAAELSARLAVGTRPLPDRPVVLTFDDGYADFHRRAMPVLAQHGFTATLFVTTGWEQDPDLRRFAPGRMLNRTQLAEVAAAGIEVGGHTRSHPQLDQLPEPLVREELRASKRWLEDEIGLAVPGLAYPFGYSSPLVRRVAREAGYRYAHAVATGRPAPTQTCTAAPADHPAGHHPARIPPAGGRGIDPAAARGPRAHPRLVGRPPGQGGLLLVTPRQSARRSAAGQSTGPTYVHRPSSRTNRLVSSMTPRFPSRA